jgi:tetratricopeptide (TPR) repeat protein
MMLLVIAPALAQDATPTGGDALQRYYTANGLLNRGLHELALVEYQAFLETSGDHAKAPVARYGMGLCLMELDRPDEAVVVLAPVVTKRDGPYVTESRLLMAQAHVARGDLPAAVAPLEAAVRETDDDHPLLPEAWGLLVDVQSRRGAHREVIAGAETVRSRWPDHAVAEHVTLRQGLAAMALGEHEEAALAFEDVRERFPDGAMQPRATLALAQALHRTERPERAAPFYREVLDGKDSALLPDAQYGYALLLHRGDDAQAALAQLAKFLEQSPDHERTADVERLAGRILYENGRHDQAIALFGQAATREPGRAAESALWIAKCHLAMDAPDDAVVVLRESLGAHPDDAVAGDMRYELALGLVRADAPAEAIAPLRTPSMSPCWPSSAPP